MEEDIFKIIVPLGQKVGAKTGGIKGGVKGGVKSGVKLSNRQKEILVYMKRNSTISYNELAQKLEINPSAVQKHIKKLKEKKIIKRIGEKKGGYWKIMGEG